MNGLERPRPSRIREDRRCTVDGCANTTTGRKPYCIDHIDRLPYVRQLTDELARRDSPALRGSAYAAEVLDQLEQQGRATVGRLAREVGVPLKRLEPCIATLVKAGILRSFTLNARNGRTLRIVELAPGGHAAGGRVAG